jgi:hypothetical protein
MKINLIHSEPTLSLIASTSLVLSTAFTANAQSGSEDIGAFGFLGQLNKGVTYENNVAVGPVACVPTAVANGLFYLQHYAAMQDKPDPFTVTPDDYGAVNDLAAVMGTSYKVYFNPDPPPRYVMSGGTTIVDSALGLMKYLSPKGQNPAPTVSVTGQYMPNPPQGWLGDGSGAKSFADNFAQTIPTATYLANALNANDGVEIGIQFGNFGGTSALDFNPTGGHEVTLYDIDLNPKTERGTIDFIDPFGDSAFTVEGNLTLTDGFLYVQFKDKRGDSVFGRIVDDMVESVGPAAQVPDGAVTFCLLGGCVTGLGALRRWRWKTR